MTQKRAAGALFINRLGLRLRSRNESTTLAESWRAYSNSNPDSKNDDRQ
jgi:hypothetical protein